jgi:hypothetical protein
VIIIGLTDRDTGVRSLHILLQEFLRYSRKLNLGALYA